MTRSGAPGRSRPRGRPRRRPALARALSARILEVRIADEASDTEAQAARDAAAKLQEVVREADTEAEAGGQDRPGRPSSRSAASSPSGRSSARSCSQSHKSLCGRRAALDDVLGEAFVDRFDVWSRRRAAPLDLRRALCSSPGRRPTRAGGDAVVWEGGGRVGSHGGRRRGRRARS